MDINKESGNPSEKKRIEEISTFFNQERAPWDMSVYDKRKEPWGTYNAMRYRESYALDMIKDEPRGTAIDLGCGIGHTLVMLRKMGFARVVGVDISEGMLGEAEKLLKEEQLCEAVSLYRADVQHLAMIESSSVDVCTALGVIEYQDEDAPLLNEINRILKPGGTAVIQVRNYDCVYVRTMMHFHSSLSNLKYREHKPMEFKLSLLKYGFNAEKERFSHFYALYPVSLNVVPSIYRLVRPFDNYLSKKFEAFSSYGFSRYLASMYIVCARKV